MPETLPDHVTPLWGKASGNLLFVVGRGPEARVLKLFRARRGPWRQALGSLSHRAFERKRGVSAAERAETERLGLELWRREGFDVPRVLEGELPEWAERTPYLWLEYTPGRILQQVLVDPETPAERREELARRLGAEHARRHRRALELREPLLLQEHPTTKHVLVSGERLVTIDLENAYRADYPVPDAVAHDLAGTLRSLWKSGPPPPLDRGVPGAYLSGYGDRELLERSVALALSAAPGWLLWRLQDSLRRRRRAKGLVMRRLAAALASGELQLAGAAERRGC